MPRFWRRKRSVSLCSSGSIDQSLKMCLSHHIWYLFSRRRHQRLNQPLRSSASLLNITVWSVWRSYKPPLLSLHLPVPSWYGRLTSLGLYAFFSCWDSCTSSAEVWWSGYLREERRQSRGCESFFWIIFYIIEGLVLVSSTFRRQKWCLHWCTLRT